MYQQLRKKLDPKLCEYMMVGYNEEITRYRLLDLKNSRRTIMERDLVESIKPTIEDEMKSEKMEIAENDIIIVKFRK